MTAPEHWRPGRRWIWLSLGARLSMPCISRHRLKIASIEKEPYGGRTVPTYNRAAGYGMAEVTTVATYRIAEIYQQLSSD